MSRDEVIAMLQAEMPRFRRDYRVRSLSLFGSVARNSARRDSDVDLLVEFDGAPTFKGFMGLKLALEKLLGRQIDLVTRTGLPPRVRTSVDPELVRVT